MEDQEPRWRPLAIAVGLITAGVLALNLASWLMADDLADVSPGQGWIRVFTVAIVLGVGAVVLLRHRPLAALMWGLVVVSLGATVLAVIGFVLQYRAGFPGLCTLFAAVGGVAVAVGTLLMRPVPAGRWRFPSVHSGLSAASALVLVAVIATPLVLTVPDWPLAATTAATGEPAAVPDMVSQVAWSTEVDGPIKDAVAAGMGAVVMLNDGVIGVDGTTGEIRWSRRRAGAEAEQIDVTPDGKTVLVQMSPTDKNTIHREALDAFTGELRFAANEPNPTRPSAIRTLMTNVSWIYENWNRTEFSANSITDGDNLWTFRAPARCRILGDLSQHVARDNGVLLPLACDQEFRYVSVDAATGGLRWQHIVPLSERSTSLDFRLDLASDHKLVEVYVKDAPPEARFTILDTADGSVLPAVGADLRVQTRGIGEVRDSDSRKLVDIRSGRVLATESDVVKCALGYLDALLPGGGLCREGSQKQDEQLATTGALDLNTVRFGESTIRTLPVSFGGPFVNQRMSKFTLRAEAVPGAVIAFTEFQPVDGRRSRLVGLR